MFLSILAQSLVRRNPANMTDPVENFPYLIVKRQKHLIHELLNTQPGPTNCPAKPGLRGKTFDRA